MDSDTEIQLRRSLGQFATGVTVVTCCASDGSPRGITANSFSSVSLAPPLVLWNIAKVSNSLNAYLNAERFAVHVLRADQQSFAEHFARTDHAVYNGIDYEVSDDNVPILRDVLARFDCATEAIHNAGDHHIIIGKVLAHMSGDGAPLLFHGGEYIAITPG
jgi:flavin reductase (DIM6/NTAB) family NADH-FMN oxidoreductase RutF